MELEADSVVGFPPDLDGCAQRALGVMAHGGDKADGRAERFFSFLRETGHVEDPSPVMMIVLTLFPSKWPTVHQGSPHFRTQSLGRRSRVACHGRSGMDTY